MQSSGIKRGLATTAVSALALTGLPFITGPASAEPATAGYGANQVALLSQETGKASTRNDGTDTTVRLEAGAGSSVSSVTFQYSNDAGTTWIDIATVASRNDDGFFAHEWTPTGLAGATVTIRAIKTGEATDTPAQDAQATAISSTAASVNITSASQLGYATDTSDPAPDAISMALSGTSSATAPTPVDVYWFDGATPVYAGTAQTKADGTWSMVTDRITVGTAAGQYDLTGDPDQIAFLATIGMTDGNTALVDGTSDDVEAFTLYSQNQSGFTVTATAKDSSLPDGSTPSNNVTVTVKDSSGRPAAGVRVESSNTDEEHLTGANGQATFTQEEGTTAYYFTDLDDDETFDGPPEAKSNDVTIASYSARPTSLRGVSDDGSAFDWDEYNSANDITVVVNDQEGDPVQPGATQQLRYYWMFTPFDGGAPVRYPDQTATPNYSVATGTGPEYVTPLPNDGSPSSEDGTYELYAELTDDTVANPPVNGIDASKVLTVNVGDATLTLDGGNERQAAAGGDITITGSLTINDGAIGLPNRDIDLSYDDNESNWSYDLAGETPDAVFVQAGTDDATVTVTTNGQGAFSATLDDPAENPQPLEDGRVYAETAATPEEQINPPANGEGTSDAQEWDEQDVNFVASVTPARVTITEESTGSAENPRTAGTVQYYSVCVESDSDPSTAGVQGEPLTNQAVNLTLTDGYFTTGEEAQQSDGSDAGYWEDLGAQEPYTTGDNGCAYVKTSIGRDTGFDDDGDVTATMTATAGNASDTESVYWTSENPLNGGSVSIEFASADQQESGLANPSPAQTSDSVEFVVKTFDQFDNRVGGEEVSLSDNTNSAGFVIYNGAVDGAGDPIANTLVTDYDEESDGYAEASQATSQTITATWEATTNTWEPFNDHYHWEEGSETLTDTLTIQWYETDFSRSTFTLDDNTGGQARVGETVTETYTARDQFGQPIENIYVKFFRNGPGSASGTGDGNANAETGEDGKVSYTYQGTQVGNAVTRAEAYTDFDQVGGTGDLVEGSSRSDTVVFTAAATPPTDNRSDVVAVLRGRNNGARPDRLRVDANARANGAKVILYRIEKQTGRFIRLRAKYLDSAGDARFKVRDGNGRRLTQYIARVRGTADTKPTITNRIRVR